MVKRGFLICIVGIDGSGKTTLAKHLVSSLQGEGVRCQYTYGRFLPVFVKPIWTFARLIFWNGRNISKDYPVYSAEKRRRLKGRFYSYLHEFLVLTDYFWQIQYKVTPRLILGMSLICDRYVYDTIITDLAPDLGLTDGNIRQRINYCFKFLPKPDLVLFLDVPPEVSLSRKQDIASLEYITERRRLYRSLSLESNGITLDGTLPIEVVNLQAIQVVHNRLFKDVENS